MNGPHDRHRLQRQKAKSRFPSRMTSKNGNSNSNCQRGLFFEEWGDKGEDVLGYYLVTLGGGVGAVSLHHAVYSVDSLEKEGEQGDVVLLGEQGVGFVELADVVGAVVRDRKSVV